MSAVDCCASVDSFICCAVSSNPEFSNQTLLCSLFASTIAEYVLYSFPSNTNTLSFFALLSFWLFWVVFFFGGVLFFCGLFFFCGVFSLWCPWWPFSALLLLCFTFWRIHCCSSLISCLYFYSFELPWINCLIFTWQLACLMLAWVVVILFFH